FLVEDVEERDDLEAFLAETRVVGQREPEIAGAHDRDAQLAIEPEDLPQVPSQVLHVVADAAHAKLAEVRQILANLRGIQPELLGEPLRRDGQYAGGIELGEAAQVDRQPVRGELGDLLWAGTWFVRRFHKTAVDCRDRVEPRSRQSRINRLSSTPRTQPHSTPSPRRH